VIFGGTRPPSLGLLGFDEMREIIRRGDLERLHQAWGAFLDGNVGGGCGIHRFVAIDKVDSNPAIYRRVQGRRRSVSRRDRRTVNADRLTSIT
jgi:hypothetical protein